MPALLEPSWHIWNCPDVGHGSVTHVPPCRAVTSMAISSSARMDLLGMSHTPPVGCLLPLIAMEDTVVASFNCQHNLEPGIRASIEGLSRTGWTCGHVCEGLSQLSGDVGSPL